MSKCPLLNLFREIDIHQTNSGRFTAACPHCQADESDPHDYKLSLRPQQFYMLNLHCFRCSPDPKDTNKRRWFFFECFRLWEIDYGPFTKRLSPEEIAAAWSRVASSHANVHRQVTNASNEPTLLHSVYTDLLERLDLNESDSKWLRKMGLEPDVAYALGYRTAPEDPAKIAKAMFSRWSYDLYKVPGFAGYSPEASLYTRSPSVLTPCRDSQGRILCIKMRMRDGGKSRHRLLVGGRTESVVLCHCPLGVGSKQWEVLWITEGERKADVFRQQSGNPVIGVPGTGTWRTALSVVEKLVPKGGSVVIAMDQDGKPQTLRAQNELAQCLTERGYRVSVATWNEEAKGIDDAKLRGFDITVSEWVRTEEVTGRKDRGNSNPTLSSNSTLHTDPASRPTRPLIDSEIIPFVRKWQPILRSEIPLRYPPGQNHLISKWIRSGELVIVDKGPKGQVLGTKN